MRVFFASLLALQFLSANVSNCSSDESMVALEGYEFTRLCGVNSIYLVAALLERPIDFAEARERLYDENTQAVTMQALVDYSGNLGFPGKFARISWKELSSFEEVVAIVYDETVEFNGIVHYYVVKKNANNTIYFLDAPNLPKLRNLNELTFEGKLQMVLWSSYPN